MNTNSRVWTTAVSALALLVLLAAGTLPSSQAEEGQAGSGSPLYGIVVVEAVQRLAESGRSRSQTEDRQPCPHCGRIHGPPLQADDDADSAAGHGALADRSLSVPHHVQSADATPDADRTPRYLYCPRCRVYHRQTAGDVDRNADLQH